MTYLQPILGPTGHRRSAIASITAIGAKLSLIPLRVSALVSPASAMFVSASPLDLVRDITLITQRVSPTLLAASSTSEVEHDFALTPLAEPSGLPQPCELLAAFCSIAARSSLAYPACLPSRPFGWRPQQRVSPSLVECVHTPESARR